MTPQVDDALLAQFPVPQISGGDKDGRGCVVIVGGDVHVPGAPLLSAMAAMRSAAGRLQLAVPHETAIAIGIAMPEAMVMPMEGAGSLIRDADASVIGPGMPSNERTRTDAARTERPMRA